MSTEAKRIQEQLKRSLMGPAWHGPSILELLADVDARQAAARPIAGAHSIWELVLHIAAWNKAGVRRLNGDRADLTDDENFPAVTDSSDEAWQQTIEALKRAYEEFDQAIASIDDARLEQPIISGMSSVYVTLHGIVQHGLYHAGQIALLKKI